MLEGNPGVWQILQWEVLQCTKCWNDERWASKVREPIALLEISEPPTLIKVLFVGVAPTRDGSHFYSSPQDKLRVGLFSVLDDIHNSQLFRGEVDNLPLEEGNDRFHGEGYFFIHAAKVPPTTGLAPPIPAIRVCAREHLSREIAVLRPLSICFLGRKAGFAAESVFKRKVSAFPSRVAVEDWSGSVAVAHQPRTPRTKRQAKQVLDLLLVSP